MVLRGVSALVAMMLVTAAGMTAVQSAGDRELGAHLARECVTCHQASGRVVGNVPMIIAWPEDQFIAVMNSYRSADRENAVMRAIAAKLSDEEIAALASYFGALPPQPKIN
ncbi:MAG: c-type cytochrome [Bosea sp. (in: a-proteobacteria)]